MMNQNNTRPKDRNNGRKVVRNKYRPVTLTLRGVTGFPDIYRTILVYEDNYTFSSSIQQAVSFRANSVYDTDLTYVGHQPKYYDQLTAIYDKYRVHECRISVSCLEGNSTTTMCVISPSTLPYGTPTATSFTEDRRVHKSHMIPVGGYGTVFLKHALTSTVGLNKRVLEDADTGSALASPSNIWYFNVLVFATDGTSALNTRLNIRLTFDVDFFDLENPGPSNHYIKHPELLTKAQIQELQRIPAKPQDPVDPMPVFVTNESVTTHVDNTVLSVKLLPINPIK